MRPTEDPREIAAEDPAALSHHHEGCRLSLELARFHELCHGEGKEAAEPAARRLEGREGVGNWPVPHRNVDRCIDLARYGHLAL